MIVKYVVVAVSASEDVPIYRFPPWLDRNQCLPLTVVFDVSERVRNGLTPATCTCQLGVVVPIPKAPAKVEAVVEVEVREPVVKSPEVMLEKVEEMERRMEEKKEVVVAVVPVAFRNVKFWRVVEELARMVLKVALEVEVSVPTPKFPIEEEAMYSFWA